jgi:hypothetical protein
MLPLLRFFLFAVPLSNVFFEEPGECRLVAFAIDIEVHFQITDCDHGLVSPLISEAAR